MSSGTIPPNQTTPHKVVIRTSYKDGVQLDRLVRSAEHPGTLSVSSSASNSDTSLMSVSFPPLRKSNFIHNLEEKQCIKVEDGMQSICDDMAMTKVFTNRKAFEIHKEEVTMYINKVIEASGICVESTLKNALDDILETKRRVSQDPKAIDENSKAIKKLGKRLYKLLISVSKQDLEANKSYKKSLQFLKNWWNPRWINLDIIFVASELLTYDIFWLTANDLDAKEHMAGELFALFSEKRVCINEVLRQLKYIKENCTLFGCL